MGNNFNPGAALVRQGWQPPGLPAVPTNLIHHMEFESEGLTNNRATIERTSITPGGQTPRALPGKIDSGGPLGLELVPEQHLAMLLQAQEAGATTSPAAGVFVHTLGPSQTGYTAPGALSTDVFRDDGRGQIFTGGWVQQIQLQVQNNALAKATATLISERGDYYAEPVTVHPSTGTGRLVVRGIPDEGKWRDLHVRLVDASDPAAVQLLVKFGPTVLTGTVDVAAASTAVVGTGTLFTKELAVGDAVSIDGDLRQVTAISGDLRFSIDAALVGPGAAADAHVVSEFGTFVSTIPAGFNLKNSPLWGELVDSVTGVPIAPAGGAVELFLETVDGLSSQNLTGTVEILPGAQTVSGTGTLFTIELAVGSLITPAGRPGRVASIVDNENLILAESHAGVPAGSSATTDHEWVVAMGRPEWIPALPQSQPLNEIFAAIEIDGVEACVEDLTLTLEVPVVARKCIGDVFTHEIIRRGRRKVTLTLSREYLEVNLRDKLEAGAPFAFYLRALTGERIGTHDQGMETICPKMSLSGATPSVSSATEMKESITASGHPAPEEPTFRDDLTIVVTSRNPDPTA